MAPKESDMEDLMLMDDPDFDRVMECVFGIRKHESRVYFTLIEFPGSTVSELADDLDRDRSNINRSLGTLHEKQLIERQRRLLEGGGYVYQYFAHPLPVIKERLHHGVDEWCEQVHETIENI